MNKIILTTEDLTRSLPELLENGGSFPLCITGWSMRPLLRQEKDIVWLRAFEGTAHRGQILLFQRENGRHVLHRVRKLLPDQRIQMNGDSQNWCEVIRPDQICAEVYEIIRSGKRIPCSCVRMRIYQTLWYPTLKIRPFIFSIGSKMKKVLKIFKSR